MSKQIDGVHYAPPMQGFGPFSAGVVSRHLTTAPRTVEQSISLISAGVSALDGLAITEDEKERVWRLIEKATERMKNV